VNKDQRAEIIGRLASAPERARQAAAAALGKARPEGEWPVHIVVGHMLHVEGAVWQARFRQMAAEDNPFWEYWEPDGIDWEGLYGSRSVDDVLSGFMAVRQATVDYLQSLSDEGWRRTGTHRRWGVVDVAYLCDQIAQHDEAHIGQIEQ
jgi:hypothetical protein